MPRTRFSRPQRRLPGRRASRTGCFPHAGAPGRAQSRPSGESPHQQGRASMQGHRHFPLLLAPCAPAGGHCATHARPPHPTLPGAPTSVLLMGTRGASFRGRAPRGRAFWKDTAESCQVPGSPRGSREAWGEGRRAQRRTRGPIGPSFGPYMEPATPPSTRWGVGRDQGAAAPASREGAVRRQEAGSLRWTPLSLWL